MRSPRQEDDFPRERVVSYPSQQIFDELDQCPPVVMILEESHEVKKHWPLVFRALKKSQVKRKNELRVLDRLARDLHWGADVLDRFKSILLVYTPFASWYADGCVRVEKDSKSQPGDEPISNLIRTGKFWIDTWQLRLLADSVHSCAENLHAGKGKHILPYAIEHQCAIRLSRYLKPRHIAALLRIVFPASDWTSNRVNQILKRARKRHPFLFT